MCFFFFKQKTAYEMRISDWSSDVCSSDLPALEVRATRKPTEDVTVGLYVRGTLRKPDFQLFSTPPMPQQQQLAWLVLGRPLNDTASAGDKSMRSEEHTSELQSLMRISYAVFCLKKKNTQKSNTKTPQT